MSTEYQKCAENSPLLDIMEVYDIRISDVTYAPAEYAFATLTLDMRLTGSFVAASLLVKALSSRAKNGGSADDHSSV